MLDNLKTMEEYLNESADLELDDELFESEDGDLEFLYDGELYEAKVKLTAKERKKAQDIGQLMSALNKNAKYKAAKEKFIKTFKVEAKKVVKAEKLNPKVLKKIDKVTIRDI